MKTQYIGSLWLLKRIPGWIILFLGPLCTTGVIWLLRIIFEKRLYDYSLASFPGGEKPTNRCMGSSGLSGGTPAPVGRSRVWQGSFGWGRSPAVVRFAIHLRWRRR